MKKDIADIGLEVMYDILNGTFDEKEKSLRLQRLDEEINIEQMEMNRKEVNGQKYSQRIEQANKVISPQLMPQFTEELIGMLDAEEEISNLIDLSLEVISHLKNDETMDFAKKLLDDKSSMDKFFVQNFVLRYSDKGADFVIETLDRPASEEELEMLRNKQEKVQKHL